MDFKTTAPAVTEIRVSTVTVLRIGAAHASVVLQVFRGADLQATVCLDPADAVALASALMADASAVVGAAVMAHQTLPAADPPTGSGG